MTDNTIAGTAQQTPPPSQGDTVVGADSARPALTFDVEQYRGFMFEAGWSKAQEDQFLATYWQIIVGFVDLGFDIHPVQQALQQRNALEVDSSAVVGFEGISGNTENFVAERSDERAAERIES